MPAGSSTAFDRLDPRIQRWIWQSGWTELKDVQERAIPAILDGEGDVILAAATASGKTEAAYLPILTRIVQTKTPTSVLYISPLKALINDQWSRLTGLAESLEVPVIPWHGDISASMKQRFAREPMGCLLITPESLEGILMREGHALERLLGGLAYVVIDELHAFIDTERGKQLQSLLHRVEVALQRRVPRVGLSATLGNMRLAADFLRPGDGASVTVIESADSGQELRVLLKGFVNKRTDAGAALDAPSAAWFDIAQHLYSSLRGSNNLIFPNNRRTVELLADMLRCLCEADAVPNEFWPHHGSLSREIRTETEQALKNKEWPATAIATTTLELGIDIGAVKSVAQIGAAPSVASLRQRLGRSGRRKGEPAILRLYTLEDELDSTSTVSDQLREGLIQAIAQVELLVKGWFEPPRLQALNLSTLVQQLLSLVAQYGGVTAGQAWNVLCASGVFDRLSQRDFAALLRELGRREVLMQDASGVLLHGPVGERIVNHYTFLAAFVTADEFRVTHAGKALGTLPLSRPVSAGSYIIFAGRRWRVTVVHPEDKVLEVEPAQAGKVPLFDGGAGKVHDRVRQQMRDVLASETPVAFLDVQAAKLLAEARASYRRLGLKTSSVVGEGSETRVFTWRGDWVNDALALMLTARGLPALNEGMCIHVHVDDRDRLLDAFDDIAASEPPKGEELAQIVGNKLQGKWDVLLPVELLGRNYASEQLDVEGAVAAAAYIADMNQ